MSLTFEIRSNPKPRPAAERQAILAKPGFGKFFTDHMAVATWTDSEGWHDSAVVPYGPFAVDPASAVLHYAQEIFEGLKAYQHADGSVSLFRPEANAARFARSAERLALPVLSGEDFLASIESLIMADRAWVPSGEEQSLYLRPFMFASEVFLGVRPARRVTYCVIASPAASYFSGGVQPVHIWVSQEFTRAAPGGTGAAKCGGNYAASLIAQAQASEKGCEQVLFADGREQKWVEELGGMNIYLVTTSGELVTPELTGSILEGVTRSSILELATELGLRPVEKRIAVEAMLDDIDSGEVVEAFACGTAAVVTPIAGLKQPGREVTVGDGSAGTHTQQVRARLLDIQYGRAEDTHGWLRKVS